MPYCSGTSTRCKRRRSLCVVGGQVPAAPSPMPKLMSGSDQPLGATCASAPDSPGARSGLRATSYTRSVLFACRNWGHKSWRPESCFVSVVPGGNRNCGLQNLADS